MYFGYGFEEYSDYQETVKNHEDIEGIEPDHGSARTIEGEN